MVLVQYFQTFSQFLRCSITLLCMIHTRNMDSPSHLRRLPEMVAQQDRTPQLTLLSLPNPSVIAIGRRTELFQQTIPSPPQASKQNERKKWKKVVIQKEVTLCILVPQERIVSGVQAAWQDTVALLVAVVLLPGVASVEEVA